MQLVRGRDIWVSVNFALLWFRYGGHYIKRRKRKGDTDGVDSYDVSFVRLIDFITDVPSN